MTSAEPATRAKAREMIERALVTRNGHGGLGAAFDQLERRLRQPYASALTEDDCQAIRDYLTVRVESALALLERRGVRPDYSLWSAPIEGQQTIDDELDGAEPPA